MSNTELKPDEVVCQDGGAAHADRAGGVAVEVILPREVPLGGPRAMTVRRVLPHRQRTMIGAWCFVDHYGPDDVSATGGMDVAPHPHTGLQTASWLFDGAIDHIDSGGNVGRVLPGELNLMTAGSGICHSEVSTPETTVLRGVQLWIALPDRVRHTAGRRFVHYAPPTTPVAGGSALVFLGALFGRRSPVETFSPVVGAEVHVDAGAEIVVDVDPRFEHGLLADDGALGLEGVPVPPGAIAYTGLGADRLRIANTGAAPARALLIGGAPFGEELVMWWNFIGRDSDEISRYRAEWEAGGDRFGRVDGYVGRGGPGRNGDGFARIPAPPLPGVRLKPRRNAPPHPHGSVADTEF